MKELIAYDDAVDLLDADHVAVKKMFTEFSAMCEKNSPAAEKRILALAICKALTVHSQIEEEIFYPKVREAIGEEALMDIALEEHAEAKAVIARIEGMKATDPACDATVKQLGKLIDRHVMEEREQIFLKARNAKLDLRGMTLPLMKRQQQLKKENVTATAAATATATAKETA